MRAGDTVRLRSPDEILATLDDQGRFEGVPFMPEMLAYFGGTFTIAAKVERACDTVGYSGVRRLRDTVTLDDLRCDGSGHAGCQAQCRLYWKEAWLRPAKAHEAPVDVGSDKADAALQRRAYTGVHRPGSTAAEPLFRCQATELLSASEPVGRWDIRSFVHELTSNNVGIRRFVSVMTRIVVEEIGRRLGLLSEFPFPPAKINGRTPTPPPQGLREGQLVQIRSGREISQTLDERGKSRGLWFDREMKPYCGCTARVKAKVERFIDEGSGRLVELASDCYILDGVVCDSARSTGRWFCPRAIYPWWREAWLKPVDQNDGEERVSGAD